MNRRPNTPDPAATAKVAEHPVHPMLIYFPIAFLAGAFLADIAYAIDGDPGFARGAVWLLGLGVVTALLAALAGFADFLGDSRIRRIGDAWQHMIGNLVAVVLAIANLIVRLEAGAEAGVVPVGLLLSAAVVVVLVFTGWKGGELVFRHRVAVNPPHPAFADKDLAGEMGEAAVSHSPLDERVRDEARPRPH
jgi:uncharacterized membrane protein